ncbi:MAG: hypothetical protein U5K69_10675 [Balneolaceae bacterium]|nr:hypothetical protein [Balneolaceae bacterium]
MNIISRAYPFSISLLMLIVIFTSGCGTDSGPVTGWQHMGLDGATINTLNLQKEKLYAGSSEGIYRKENDTNEAGWEHLDPDKQVHDFVVWDDQTLLVGTAITDDDTVSIYKTTNGGSSWVHTSKTLAEMSEITFYLLWSYIPGMKNFYMPEGILM